MDDCQGLQLPPIPTEDLRGSNVHCRSTFQEQSVISKLSYGIRKLLSRTVAYSVTVFWESQSEVVSKHFQCINEVI